MISIGNNKVGLFYEKNKETYNEIGSSNFEVENKYTYAKTCTGNVILLLNENNEILDIDDIPTSEATDIVGENFISYVQSNNCYVFAIGWNILESDTSFTKNSLGTIVSFVTDIITDDFNLNVTDINIECDIKEEDMEENSILLVYTELKPIEDASNKMVTISMANAKLLNLQK